MKSRLSFPIAAVLLCMSLMLGGCGGDTSTLSTDSSALPDPVSGTYNGQTITMKVAVMTDMEWHEMNPKTSVFVNGFAGIYFYDGLSEKGEDEDDTFHGASYMDKNGRLISEPKYLRLKDFNEDGLAFALGMDGVYYVLDKTGKEVETRTEDSGDWSEFNYENPYADAAGFVAGLKTIKMGDHLVVVDKSGKTVASLPDMFREANMAAEGLAVCIYGGPEDGWYGQYMQLYDTDGKLLNETKFERIGTFYKGLAPVYKDGKLGLISDKGEMVIPLSISCRADHRYIAFNEDRIVVSIDGKVSIIEVTRS